ncbi:MAG: hypothetical protein QOE61_846 [Micromonosporaceae bacterium]|jgi:hypothetical protein|nr:hypothetical protein [Micromonosporaceae bacterium]
MAVSGLGAGVQDTDKTESPFDHIKQLCCGFDRYPWICSDPRGRNSFAGIRSPRGDAAYRVSDRASDRARSWAAMGCSPARRGGHAVRPRNRFTAGVYVFRSCGIPRLTPRTSPWAFCQVNSDRWEGRPWVAALTMWAACAVWSPYGPHRASASCMSE